MVVVTSALNGASSPKKVKATPAASPVSAATTTPAILPRWTLADVKANSTAERPLYVWRGLVHDLTDFVDSHPGGDIMLDYHGQVIDEVMVDARHHVHSEAALDMLREYVVGRVTSVSVSGEGGKSEGATSTAADSHDDNELARMKLDAYREANDPAQPHAQAMAHLDDYVSPTAAGIRDEFLDLDQPLLWQLWSKPGLNRELYLREVHKPRILKEPARIFANPVLEVLSRTPWYVVPMVWLPVIAMGFAHCREMCGASVAMTLGVVGMFYWTLFEYTAHRFLFHLDDNLPEVRGGLVFHFLVHGVHHYLPQDRLRLVFPPAAACILLFAHVLPCSLLLSRDYNIGFHAGLLLGYVMYDMVHYYLHHARPSLEYFRTLKSYHNAHHYKNYHLGYGITSKVWDYAFGTVLY